MYVGRLCCTKNPQNLIDLTTTCFSHIRAGGRVASCDTSSSGIQADGAVVCSSAGSGIRGVMYL